MLNVLDLFSGIGGFSLGLERTGGFQTVAFCEIEPFCRSVINKHWPGVPVYDDVKTLDAARLAADGISVDVLCGGFPCQDISTAGRGAGLSGERSGLWWEFYRLIQEIRPQYALIENVSALRSRGLDEVLGALAAIGYDAEWHCIPASAVGAPHRRDRVWIVAHPQSHGGDGSIFASQWETISRLMGSSKNVADAHIVVGNARWSGDVEQSAGRRDAGGSDCGADGMADADCAGLERQWRIAGRVGAQFTDVGSGGWWATEPDVGRVAHVVPARVDRLRALGNAVVPQIPEILGRAILAQCPG